MDEVFLEEFYNLGKQIERIRNVIASPNMDHAQMKRVLEESHEALLTYVFHPPVSRAVSHGAADRLLEVLAETHRDWTAEILSSAVATFEQALQVELKQSPVFMLNARGTHDSRILLLSPGSSFEDKYWYCLSVVARRDWTEASRCLAYSIPTGCGFHAIRALEAVAIDYLSKLAVQPKKRDLGQYLSFLSENGADPKAIEAAQQIRGLHRNPLMHPEDFLDTHDAIDVFDLCKCAIRALLRDMERHTLITPKEPTTYTIHRE